MLVDFLISVDNRLLSGSDGFDLNNSSEIHREDGSVETIFAYQELAGQCEVRRTNVAYPRLQITAQWIEVTNTGGRELSVHRLDTVFGILPQDHYTLHSFDSGWGTEFTPVSIVLDQSTTLESRSGRSSQGKMPWLALTGASGSIFACSIAWSGNWIMRLEPDADGSVQFCGGLSDWKFRKLLQPGETMRAPAVVFVFLEKGTIDDVSLEFGVLTRDYWCPSNELKKSMPVEWNHWWPYEDVEINEDVFKANADVAASMGVDVCTLDAGWFGEQSAKDGDAGWYQLRGDWDIVNRTKFPSGLKHLSDYVHNRNMKFGIWCEIEAIGDHANLANNRPDFVATRDGVSLGYVCLGNPKASKWALETLSYLIEKVGADWIKLDFNLDPGAGCNRIDHGHGEGDGLYAHYMAYYDLLQKVREVHPSVILENCSSGGLRLDIGIIAQTHLTFLSDPDYAVHSLQNVWGASNMLHPSACLKFAWSQTRESYGHNGGTTDPLPDGTPLHKVDYIIRVAMLNHFGLSYRLPGLPDYIRKRVAEHIDLYRSSISDFVRTSDFYRLTGQPQRDGSAGALAAFQYLKQTTGEAAVFVFRIPCRQISQTKLKLKALSDDEKYSVRFNDSGQTVILTGRSLTVDGVDIGDMPEESSEIIWISPIQG
jgi:alpha-galactosidase